MEDKFAKGGRITDAEINVGSRFGLPNGEVVEIKKRFIEDKYKGDDRVIVFTRSSDNEEHESTVNGLRTFLNNWKAQLINAHTEQVLGERYWTKFENGGGLEWRMGSSIGYNTKKEAQKRLQLLKQYPEEYRNLRVDKSSGEYVVRFEYLKNAKFSNGGGLYINAEEYRDKLEAMTAEQLAVEYDEQIGVDVSPAEAEDEREEITDRLVEQYIRVMRSRGERGFEEGGELS